MNRIQSLVIRLFKLETHHLPNVVLPKLNPDEIRLSEWQENERLVMESGKLAAGEVYQGQIRVLENEHPCHFVFSATGIDPTSRIAHQAKIEGYELCLNNLKAFTKSKSRIKSVTPTFQPPEDK